VNDDPIASGKVQRILDLARAANNQQNPEQAIALIRSLELDGSQVRLERERVESRLILAEAYTAKGNQLADALFEETFELLSRLSIPEVTLEIRSHEHFADYLRCFAKRPSLARQHYEYAKVRAVNLRMEEDSARIQLKIETIELGMDQSPEAGNFATLKRVAKQGGYTCAEQLAAWLNHKGQAAHHDRGLAFARNRGQAGEQYFKYLLDMVRMKT
jgi:hypothetical protein